MIWVRLPKSGTIVPHDHAAARIQDAGEVVVLLADERRHRGALDDGFHVRLGRPQCAADDLARHRVGRQGGAAARGRPRHRGRPVARITRLPARSTVARCPGGTTVVASSCSTMAGPVTTAPAPSWSRSTHGHVFQPAPAK